MILLQPSDWLEVRLGSAARARNLTTEALCLSLLRVIAADNLYDAVLDDAHTGSAGSVNRGIWVGREDDLRKLASEGKSAREIGLELGVSKAAVVGKCNRLGLSLNGKPKTVGEQWG